MTAGNQNVALTPCGFIRISTRQRSLALTSTHCTLIIVYVDLKPLMGNNTVLPGNQVDTTHTLLDLSTEVLIEILAYLPPADSDMISVQHTCRLIRDIVDGTEYLQYILRTQIKGIEDFLPHDFPYSERLALLRRHGHWQSWSSSQFNMFTKCYITEPLGRFTLQGGYLINEYTHGRWIEYRYTDLCTAVRNEELPRWVHVKMKHCRLPILSEIVFSVDHDLVIASKFCVISDLFLSPKSDEPQKAARHQRCCPCRVWLF